MLRRRAFVDKVEDIFAELGVEVSEELLSCALETAGVSEEVLNSSLEQAVGLDLDAIGDLSRLTVRQAIGDLDEYGSMFGDAVYRAAA